MSDSLAPRPAHVPPHLVIDFDFREPRGMVDGDDVYQAWHRLHDGPDIFWTPRHGGHWVLTRSEDIKAVQKDFARFSHKEFTLPRGQNQIRRVPIEVDPPEHAAYRTVINPIFSPRAIAELEPTIRRVAVETIEALQPRGRCEFVEDFARVLPGTVFLGMMKLPITERETFSAWTRGYASATTLDGRREAFELIIAYMRKLIAERETDRRDDFVSYLLNTRDEGRRLQDPDDIVGMLTVLLAGGLDTVANMLSFTTRFLATSPAHRRRLLEEPAIIPRAAEEFIRRFGLSNTIRIVTEDTPLKDVVFKADDAVMVPIGMSGMDPLRYDDPLAIDFDRGVGAHEHDTFGNGPHRCPGAPLARTEVGIFLEEWLPRIPDFAVDPEDAVVTVSGLTNQVRRLPLVWNT